MGTRIEWCDETWNPITGCTPISEGCKNCYAARMARRLAGRYGYPADDPFRVGVVHENVMADPGKWRKPRKVFAGSMTDHFHADIINNHQGRATLVELWDAFFDFPQHTFMLLTKRPNGARWFAEWMRKYQFRRVWYPNIWLGVTAENQHRADERIRVLLSIPAAVRFVSVEPMLGPVDLERGGWSFFRALVPPPGNKTGWKHGLSWVICGPETGPGARPFNHDWARELRDQCREAGVPFFYKRHDKPETPDDLRIAEFPN